MATNADLKIFLVDDEPYCLDLYGRYLQNLGYGNVQYFSKSADCLDQLILQPDLIFLDYNMDNLNGIDVLKKIKRFDPNISIVFLSGQREISIALNALKYGALDYIRKEDIDEVRLDICMKRVIYVKENVYNSSVLTGLFINQIIVLAYWLGILKNKMASHGNHPPYIRQG